MHGFSKPDEILGSSPLVFQIQPKQNKDINLGNWNHQRKTVTRRCWNMRNKVEQKMSIWKGEKDLANRSLESAPFVLLWVEAKFSSAHYGFPNKRKHM